MALNSHIWDDKVTSMIFNNYMFSCTEQSYNINFFDQKVVEDCFLVYFLVCFMWLSMLNIEIGSKKALQGYFVTQISSTFQLFL